MAIDGNDHAAAFIQNLQWDRLPPEVQMRARMCLLDGLGATLAGTLTPASRIAAETASHLWRSQDATIFLHNRGARAAGAAFANATAANGLDVDDDAIFTRGHPGAQLVPTVLAVGETVGASGKAVLEALVIGYEIAIRAGRCWHDDHEIYQSCGSWGSLACAAAAARLYGLQRQQTWHALGIADYHAPNAPMMRDIHHPSMVKHAIGWGAMNGITAAELAQRGFTGIPSLLGFEKYRDWVMNLGEHYWMADWVFYKNWCSCAWGHAACQAAIQLVEEQGIRAEHIAAIRVRTFDEATQLYQGYPTTTEEAQFSVRWPLACLLVDGDIGPEQVLEKHLEDPLVRAMFDKIELALDPDIDALYKQAQEMDLRMHSAVTITLKDGRVVDSGIVERGADRYSLADLQHKFRQNVSRVLPEATVEQLIAWCDGFEHIDDIRRFSAVLI